MIRSTYLSRPDWWRPAVAPQAIDASASSERSAPAFWALMGFMFFLLIAPQTFVPGLQYLHLAAVAVGIACIAHVSNALRHGYSVLGTHPSVRWAAALAGWALLTAPFSYWPGGTIALLLDLYFKSLVIFWLVGVLVDTQRRLRQLVTWLTLLTVPIGITAIVHFMTGAFVQGGDRAAPRIMGYDAPLTGNPNDLALVLCMLLPLAVAVAAGQRRLLACLAFSAIVCLDIVAVIITFSRTGFLTLVVLGAFALFKLFRGRWRFWAVAIVGLGFALLPFLPEGYMQHMGTITAIETDPTGSAQARWSDTLTAARLVLANPITGAGAGMSTLALNEARGASWVPVHNVYLEYATDLGLPGLFFFLLLLGSCYRKVMQVVRQTALVATDWDFCCIAQGVQMTLVAFIVAGFFHPVAYHFHFYYAAGLSVALAVVWENEYA
jgi:O-antigen ligase